MFLPYPRQTKDILCRALIFSSMNLLSASRNWDFTNVLPNRSK